MRLALPPMAWLPTPSLPLPLPPVLAHPLVKKTVMVLGSYNLLIRWKRRRSGRCRPSDAKRQAAMSELMQRLPPPDPKLVGGERVDTLTYCRFLSVCDWDPNRAAR